MGHRTERGRVRARITRPLTVLATVVIAIVVALPVASGVSVRPIRPEGMSTAPTRLSLADLALHVVGDSLVNSSGSVVRLLGVDASGTESACIQDDGFSWGPFDTAEAQSIAAWQANAVRVPLNEDCWLGINGAPSTYSGAAYQEAIEKWVAELNAAGLIAILDLQWSAPGQIAASQEWPMADADHSITFWKQVATAFKARPLVVFDLFNEPSLGRNDPSPSDWTCWLNGCRSTTPYCPANGTSGCSSVTYEVAGMQQLVDAVRSAGANQPLMIGGLDWSGAPCKSVPADGSCAWLTFEPADPLHQLVVSFHNYYDHTHCDTLTCWNATIAPLAKEAPVVTGELGEKNCSATFVDQYTQWADLHGVSYLAWTWQPDTLATSCGTANVRLLSNWSGAPSTVNPVAPFFRTHLVQEEALNGSV